VWWDAPFLVVALVFRLQRKKTQTKMESEKVYVHYQGHPEFTYIAKLDPLLTVAHLAQDFATAYRAKYGLQHMLDVSCIEVFSERYNSDPVGVKIFGASKSGKLSCFIETFFFFSMMQT
jgi:hypothetical protein